MRRGCEAPAEEWEQYVRDNAVTLARERDKKIVRLREQVTRLEKMVRSLRLALRQKKEL